MLISTCYNIVLVDEYGWMSSYGGEGENGLAIVFDDSFEHEVTHKGLMT